MGASLEEQGVVLEFEWPAVWYARIEPLVRSAGPSHIVYLDSFYIDIYEVTNAQYEVFVDATGYQLPAFWSQDQLNHPDQPVVGVSWDAANTFCAWAGKRLPTEAEWEKAARGSQGLAYPWGNTWDPDQLRSADGISHQSLDTFDAWALWHQHKFDNGSESWPAKVGSYPMGASPYGVMDMAGNVWEWVADWYDPHYYAESPMRNPPGPPNGLVRVLRGGAWDVPKVIAYSWFRDIFIPPEFSRSGVTGFRCAMSLE